MAWRRAEGGRGNGMRNLLPRFRRIDFLVAASVVVAAPVSKRPQVVEIIPQPFACILPERVVLDYIVDVFNRLVQSASVKLTPVISVLKFGKISDGIVEADPFMVRIPAFGAPRKLL